MVERLAAAIERERHFNADASHQLRTPLAGLQLELEAALANEATATGPVLAATLGEVRRLQAVVDDVLTMARTDPHERSRLVDRPPISTVLAQVERRWHGRLARDGRRLESVLEQAHESTPVPGRVVEHILDVLLDNAPVHGRVPSRSPSGMRPALSRSLSPTKATCPSSSSTRSNAAPAQPAALASGSPWPGPWPQPCTDVCC